MVLEGSEQESFGRNIFVGEKPVRLLRLLNVTLYILYMLKSAYQKTPWIAQSDDDDVICSYTWIFDLSVLILFIFIT